MQRSGSQKALLVLSIISIVFAALGILASIAAIAGGAMFGAAPAQDVSDALSGTGVTQGEASAVIGIVGLVLLLGCAFELLVGILGIRAANDNQKIMPVWWLTLITLILDVIGVVMGLMGGSSGSDVTSSIVGIVVAALMFWIANNIKREAGK